MNHKVLQPKRTLTFRKWSRKSYSLFRILNQVVRIAVLSVVYHHASANLPEASHTVQGDTTRVAASLELDEIEVGASRVPVISSSSARVVTVISRETLKYLPAAHLADALEYIPGIDIRQRGPEGIQADISIRGGSFDQTMILLNGINITDPQTGHHNFNIPVSLSQVERIEILEGPASRVYGPNSFSGAVNIITKPSEKNDFRGALTYGSHNYLNAEVSGTVRTGAFSHLLALGTNRSEGYIRNTDFNTRNFFVHSSGAFATGRLELQFGISDKAFGANSFYTPKYPEQFEKTKTFITSARWITGLPVNLTPSVYWRRHHDRFELFRYERPEWYQGHNHHLTDVLGMDIRSWFVSPIGKTALGFHARSENIWSNVLGDPMRNAIPIPGEEAHYTKHKSRNSFSAFLEQSVTLEKLNLSGGILLHRTGDYTMKWEYFPGFDISYALSGNVRWFATAGKSLRLPTFTDLYYTGPTNQGNPDLKPEKVNHMETGVKWFRKGLHGHASLYHHSGYNLIDWTKQADESIWKTTNLTTLKTTGFQISSTVDFRKMIRPAFPLYTLAAGYNSTRLNKQDNNYISYYVLDNIRHKFSVSVSHKLTRSLHCTWSALYQDRNGSYTAYDQGSAHEKEYLPFWLMNWKIYGSFGNFEIHAAVTNLAGSTYFDFGNIVQPGREFKTGISLKF